MKSAQENLTQLRENPHERGMWDRGVQGGEKRQANKQENNAS